MKAITAEAEREQAIMPEGCAAAITLAYIAAGVVVTLREMPPALVWDRVVENLVILVLPH